MGVVALDRCCCQLIIKRRGVVVVDEIGQGHRPAARVRWAGERLDQE
jgi:hypothetical protein